MTDQLARIEEYITQQAAVCKGLHERGTDGSVGDVDELKELVQLWSSTGEKITRLSRIARNLRVLKKNYEVKILAFMKENNIEVINTSNAVIQSTAAMPRRKGGNESMCGSAPSQQQSATDASLGTKLRRLQLV